MSLKCSEMSTRVVFFFVFFLRSLRGPERLSAKGSSRLLLWHVGHDGDNERLRPDDAASVYSQEQGRRGGGFI
jgi:hypothetical protein